MSHPDFEQHQSALTTGVDITTNLLILSETCLINVEEVGIYPKTSKSLQIPLCSKADMGCWWDRQNSAGKKRFFQRWKNLIFQRSNNIENMLFLKVEPTSRFQHWNNVRIYTSYQPCSELQPHFNLGQDINIETTSEFQPESI